jgi:glyoxylase-like metal-dependent hydrolase (beta-lactamase superfamily II)
MTGSVQQQVAGFYHRRIGGITVTALNDGHQDVAMATVRGIPPEEAEAMLRAAFRPVPRRTAVNAFLLRSGDRVALVDTGCGPTRATLGHLAANLAAAGIAPEQVDTLLMTHLHPDHWGGLLDDQGRAVFPRAELKLHGEEHAYWHDDAAMMRVEDPAKRQMFFAEGRARLAPYHDRTSLFTAGEVFPGVTAVPLPGHTPGHTGFMVASEGESVLIWGDIVHVQELQVSRPEVVMTVDVDPVRAAETRRRLFDQVVADRQAVAGMHLHFPAFAHLARDGSGYRLVADAWSVDLHGDTPGS